MRVCVVPPMAKWSTVDVFNGLCYGLRANGVDVVHDADGIDLMIVVDGTTRGPDDLKEARSHHPVAVLFTESPYDMDVELFVSQFVDAGWTHERTAVPAFQAVNPDIGYLPHAWHPEMHFVDSQPIAELVPAHDVVFVGSGFPERVTWFNSIDWSGIDLGLYGIWDNLGLKEQVQDCVKSGPVSNVYAAALYRRAKIGLNLHRTRQRGSREPIVAESLNPRAYELAACGTFQVSDYRAEVSEVFGASVDTFRTSELAEEMIRTYLENDARRRTRAVSQYGRMADHSWTDRAAQVLEDVRAWGLVA